MVFCITESNITGNWDHTTDVLAVGSGGGGLWTPSNYLLQQDGVDDSVEKARTYLAHAVGDRTPQSLQDAYLENAPKMIAYLSSNTAVRFQRSVGYADYYPEQPGGMAEGRALGIAIGLLWRTRQ